MEKTTITRAEYVQLRGLKLIAERHLSAINEIVENARLITGEEGRFGYMGDLMFSEGRDS